MSLDMETIMLIITILGGIASLIDIIEGVVALIKAIIKMVQWIMNKIQNEKK